MQTLAESGYYPKFWELLVIVGVPGLVLLAGYIVQRRVSGPGLPLPLPVALVYFLCTIAAYCVLLIIFGSAEPLQTRMQLEAHAKDALDLIKPHHVDNRMVLLGFYSFLFYLWPVGYAISLLRNSYATGIVDRIGPLSARIEDPSEFSSARKLALRGDVDGAVQMYRNYRENSCDALFEAARLLKAEDRFAEAAAVFQDISEKFYERRPAWAEATYQIGKINEQNLLNVSSALDLYRSILSRTPESRFAALAAHDVARLQVGDEEFTHELVEMPKAGAEKDPFFGKGRTKTAHATATPRVAAAAVRDNGAPSDDEVHAAPVDPFFQANLKQRSTVKGDVVAPAKKAAAKTPAAKKAPAKAPAAKKSAAKKPAAKKPAAKKKPAG